MVHLTTNTRVQVFLPSEFERDQRLELIFDEAFKLGASETSLIGPCIYFDDYSITGAKAKVKQALKNAGVAV